MQILSNKFSNIMTMRWWVHRSANVTRQWRHYFAPSWSSYYTSYCISYLQKVQLSFETVWVLFW